jgi:choline dehydrogenase
MKTSCFLVAALGSLAIASPASHDKRQPINIPIGMIGIPGIDTTFDYIVVGGGTGGLTIAKRLAEDPLATVAVIEAGTLYQVAEPLIAETPGSDAFFVGTKETDPTVDWGFFSAPDPSSNNEKRSYARGKCLGGRYVLSAARATLLIFFSSAKNFMIYQRPTTGSLDKWAKETGDSSYVRFLTSCQRFISNIVLELCQL